LSSSGQPPTFRVPAIGPRALVASC
jgi:hypothetical protein